MRFKRDSHMPIGIDIGGRRIKAAQLARSASAPAWRIEAAASVTRTAKATDLDRGEIFRLREALAEGGFKGKSVVLSVPSDQVITGIMELPPRDSGAPVEQLARAELGRMHKCDPNSFEMAYWDLPAPARATHSTFVMGAACSHENASRLLDAFEDGGFDVECLAVHAAAVAKTCKPLLESISGVAAILDIGWTAARLVLTYQSTVVYERVLAKDGLGPLAEMLAANLGITIDEVDHRLCSGGLQAGKTGGDAADELGEKISTAALAHFEAMSRELRVPFSYLGNQYPDAELERVFLVGGGAMIPGLDTKLGQLLEADVTVVLPKDLALCPDTLAAVCGPALTAAVGLGACLER